MRCSGALWQVSIYHNIGIQPFEIQICFAQTDSLAVLVAEKITMASEIANDQHISTDNSSVHSAETPVTDDNASSEAAHTADNTFQQIEHTDITTTREEPTYAFTQVTTTVKRIQTKNVKGRSFLELQDIMRHILKVPSRRVSVRVGK